jgi:hypothetical protein
MCGRSDVYSRSSVSKTDAGLSPVLCGGRGRSRTVNGVKLRPVLAGHVWQLEALGDGGRLGPAADAEFAKQVADVRARGFR